MIDAHNRVIDYLRISVTDRCNLRCVYCMPEEGIQTLPHSEILTFDEILKVCYAASKIGIRKIKITGGEPLVRLGIVDLIREIKSIPLIEQVTITSNGILLDKMALPLKEVGLDGVNISLDTLNPDKFTQITRRNQLSRVLEGLDASLESGIKSVKINCVPAKEFNFTELTNFAAIARDKDVCVRFIELMPIGFGKKFKPIPNEEIFASIEKVYGELKPVNERLGNGPAVYYKANGFKGSIGFISAVSNEFCETCNRIRLTSEGFLKLCLHYNKGIDLKFPLRNGISNEDLQTLMQNAIYNKPSKHMFRSDVYNEEFENKNMSQIGG